jgi:hypothetical protein
MPFMDLPTKMLPMKDQIPQSVVKQSGNPYSVKSRIVIVLMMLLSSMSTKAWAGFDYKLKNDRFTNTKSSSYELSVGSECKLLATSKGELKYCTFRNSSDDASGPSIMFTTISNGWDIMPYRSTEPYKDGKVPSIITYKTGKTLNTTLGVRFGGSPIYGSVVSENVIVELGSVKSSIPDISQIEVKYGTNEYSIVLDPILTKRALEFQE